MSKLIDDLKSAAVAVEAAVTAVRALIADLQTLHVTIPWLGWFVTPAPAPPTVDPVHETITVRGVNPGPWPFGVTSVSGPLTAGGTVTLTDPPAPHEVPNH